MSQWNNDYKHKPYNTYGGYGYDTGGYGLWVVVGIVCFLGFLGLMVGLKRAVEMYGMQTVCSYGFGLLIVSSVISVILTSIYYYVQNWIDRKFGYVPTKKDYNTVNTSNTATYTPPKENIINKTTRGFKTSGLLVGERETAPRAAFFGRLDGEAVESLGKYEEQWLNHFEYSYWLKQNERKQALKDGSLSEIAEPRHPVVHTTTKIDY